MIRRVGLAASVLTLFSVFGQIRGQCAPPDCEPGDFNTPIDPDLVPHPDQWCYTESHTVYFSCPGVYGGPSGPFLCLNGKWGANSPSCDTWTCGLPTAEDDDLIISPVKEVYVAGETVTYSCPAGFVIVGTGDASCDESGWSPDITPSCTATCSTPAIQNGNLTTDQLFMATNNATVQCYPGYDLQAGDSSIISCTDNGTWDYVPACYVPCSTAPPAGELVVLDPQESYYQHGEVVQYSCPNTFALNGSNSAQCHNGSWQMNDGTPSCQETCSIPAVQNGNLTTNETFVATNTATVQCYPGYDLQAGDSSTITCMDNRTWDYVPACYARCAIPAVANSDTTTAGEIKHGEARSIHCDNGYSYDRETTLVRSCYNGQLSEEVPSQCFLSCTTAPPAGDFVLLDTQGSYHYHGVEVQYSCPSTLSLIGSDSAQCNEGSWFLDDGTPSCKVYNEFDVSSVILFCGSTYFQIDIPDSMVIPTAREADLYFAGDPYNSDCRGFRNGDYITLNTSLTGCGTAYSDNNNMSFYQNAVEGLNMDNSSNAIVEYMDLEIPVTCEFERSAQLQAHFSTVNEILVKKEKGTFQYDFSIYESVDYSQRHNAYPVVVSLGSELYFRAELLRSPGNLQIHLRSCHATPTQNYDDPIMYPIISNGCGVEDAAVRVLVPEEPTQADFEILSFRFAHNIVDNNLEVWIHCEVILCDAEDVGSECSQGCEEPRSRRSVGTSYQRVQRMAQGPIILGGSSNQYGTLTENDKVISSSSSSASTALFGLISLTMFACMVAMGVALTRLRQRLNQHHYQPLQNAVAE